MGIGVVYRAVLEYNNCDDFQTTLKVTEVDGSFENLNFVGLLNDSPERLSPCSRGLYPVWV